MKTREHLKKINIAEIRLYELLGIKQFRKVILSFERTRHMNSKRRNENYHLQSTSDSSLLRFSGYLIYNSLFHVVSLLFIVLYFVITRYMSMKNIAVDIVILFTAVLDIYCLILQRYIYLRLQQHIYKKRQRKSKTKSNQIADMELILRNKLPDALSRETALLQEIKDKILSGKDIILMAKHEHELWGIAEVCGSVSEFEISKKETLCKRTTIAELTNSIPYETRVITPKQHFVSALQKALKTAPPKIVTFGVCITTETPSTEAAYKKIFADSSLDNVLIIIDMLLDAYHVYQKEVVMR